MSASGPQPQVNKHGILALRVAEYSTFKACNDEEARRQRWDTWPQRLRTAVYNITGVKGRPLLKKWKQQDLAADATLAAAEDRASQASQPPHQVALTPAAAPIQHEGKEKTSHDWKEGTPIGQAKKPGPSGRYSKKNEPHTTSQDHQHHLSGNHAPGWRSNNAKAQARQHGARAAPQAPNPTTMSSQTIGTPGNDGRSGTEDLRPRWRAGDQPEPPPRARGGSSGVPADHRRGVDRHATQPAQREGPRGGQEQWLTVRSREWERLQRKIGNMTETLQRLTEELENLQPRQLQPQQRHQAELKDDNPWRPLGRSAARSRNTSIGFQRGSRNHQHQDAGRRAVELPDEESATSAPLRPFEVHRRSIAGSSDSSYLNYQTPTTRRQTVDAAEKGRV